jgi:hypothetical protein
MSAMTASAAARRLAAEEAWRALRPQLAPTPRRCWGRRPTPSSPAPSWRSSTSTSRSPSSTTTPTPTSRRQHERSGSFVGLANFSPEPQAVDADTVTGFGTLAAVLTSDGPPAVAAGRLVVPGLGFAWFAEP